MKNRTIQLKNKWKIGHLTIENINVTNKYMKTWLISYSHVASEIQIRITMRKYCIPMGIVKIQILKQPILIQQGCKTTKFLWISLRGKMIQPFWKMGSFM
jgi:hypothetical protein